MTDRPIIFAAPMVRAILEGRKTQTRRLLKFPFRDPDFGCELGGHEIRPKELRNKYAVGDRLWVREACVAEELPSGQDGVRYVADNAWRSIDNTTDAAELWVGLHGYSNKLGATVPSIHMPRWASRLTLTITDVRSHRIQGISEDDAKAEGAMYHNGHGIGHSGWRHDYKCVHTDARSSFARLWDEIHARDGRINGAHTWGSNPWVVALTFTVNTVPAVQRMDRQQEAAS